jgi:tRNA (guanine37-N1)-methyltransferase
MSAFHVTILTIFPEMFPGSLGYSLAGRALAKNIWSYSIINIRDFGITKHKNVDDEACGGGNGLIMRPDVLGAALDKALELNPGSKIYYLSPRGKPVNQGDIKRISTEKNIIILCGRFEGIDERIIDEYNAQQISVGDYILSGGEVAALTVLDSVIRLLPGVLANSETLKEESFEKNDEGNMLLEYPLYTKPAIWRGRKVPEVLLSGNARAIQQWKKEQSLKVTKELRPDLLNTK